MEESTTHEGGTPATVGAVASVIADLDVAEKRYGDTMEGLVLEASSQLSGAESALAGVHDLLAGEVANALDRAEAPVVKHLQKIAGAAEADHASAINRVFAAGGQPLYVTSDMVADMERGDPVQSAMDQILSPVASREFPGAPSVPPPCPPGQAWSDLLPGCTNPMLVAPPADMPPSPIPPPAIAEPPASCPLPAEFPAGCPVPTIVVNVPPPPPAPPTPTNPYGPPPDYVCPLPPFGEPVPPEDVEPNPVVPDGYPFIIPFTDPGPGGTYEEPPDDGSIPDYPPTPTLPESPPPPPDPYDYGVPPAKGVPAAGWLSQGWSDPAACNRILARSPIGAEQAIALAMDSMRREIQAATEKDRAQWQAEIEVAKASGQPMPPETFTFRLALQPEVERLARVLMGAGTGHCLPDGGAVATVAAARLADKYAGGPWDYLATSAKYDLQATCPQFLPSQDETDHMFLTAQISEELWGCLTLANGNHIWARREVVRAKRQKADVGTWISLWRKQAITYSELEQFARSVGVLDKQDLEALVADSNFVPPYTDITRMMVRDAADEQLVSRYGYDFEFEKKFSGQLEGWARAQGITPDVMRYLWRSHWQLPSPTQLYEMLHRLRPGRVDVGIQTDREDVKVALQANDMAPGFVDRQIALSYNVITRTDLLTFMTNGSMELPEIVERLQDTGYSRADAERIADAWQLEVANRRSNKGRVWSRVNITKQYRDGHLPRGEAKRLLLRTIATEAEVDSVLDDVDLMRDTLRRSKCVKAVRRKRITGETSEREATNELLALGVDGPVALTLSEGWTCEIASMSKEPTTSMLAGWFIRGLIDVSEFDKRLRNLRFSPLDASRIIADTVMVENERMRKLAEAAARRAKADDEKRKKEAERIAEKRKKEQAEKLKEMGR
jgi:hypothetical protein